LKNKVYTFKYKKYILYEQGKLHPILNNKSSIVFEQVRNHFLASLKGRF